MNYTQLVDLLRTIRQHGALPVNMTEVELPLFGFLKPWSNNLHGLCIVTCKL